MSPRFGFVFFVAACAAAPAFAAPPHTAPAAPQIPASRQIRAQTPDKPWATYPTRILADVPGFAPPKAPPKVSQYGGWLAHKADKTGFFHTQKVGDRWWLVDPDGHLFLSVGLNAVSVSDTPAAKGYQKAAFGTPENWANQTALLLKNSGFNTAGCWSDTKALASAKPRLPYTLIWNFMSAYGKTRGGTYQQSGHIGYPNDAIFVFDKAFETFADKYAQKLADTKNDPYLLGHFSDNELPFYPNSLDKFLSLPKGDEGRNAAEAWAQANGVKPGAPTDAQRLAFVGFMSDRYYAITTRAIRKYDPNHLCLGARIHGRARRSPALWASAGKYLDVIAVNDYGTWNPNLQTLHNWSQWGNDKPLLVTEWYAKGDDSGMGNKSGAGWEVATQAERGAFYQNYTLGLLAARNVVGWHWFKYADNDVTNTAADPSNRDSNKGLVNIKLSPYPPLLGAMRDLNWSAYALTNYFDKAQTPLAHR